MTAPAAVVEELLATPIGWTVEGESAPWAPSSPHSEHRYHGCCAVCRAGDRPEALTALVTAVIQIVDAHQVLAIHQQIVSGVLDPPP